MSERALTEIIIGVFCAVILAALWLWHDHVERQAGESACMQATSETKTAAELAATKAADAYQATVKIPAEATHASDIAAITTRVVRVPLVLHDSALCADPVPGQGDVGPLDAHPAGGAVLGGPGDGIDIRPSIEALKAKYETILADYRQLNTECRSSP
jgi:hypothetical protein